ncbi:tripartite tricarboxylate transporter permease [Thermodesulfobacteriota bacterium]
MDFGHIFSGIKLVFQFQNLSYCLAGVFIGTLIGVLPGLGPMATIAILLPLCFKIPALSAIILMAGIYYGAQYGGSTTSILVNIPGESGSVITCLDGHPMAKQGRAGPALGIAAFGSFIGASISIIGLMFISKPLAQFALKFGPPEYFSLMCLGLIILTYLGQGSMAKALISAVFGLLLSLVGVDIFSGKPRLIFGIDYLIDGITLTGLMMGLFGVSEVFLKLEYAEESRKREILEGKIKNLLPTLQDWKDSWGSILRGSFTGFFMGMLPGGGVVVSSFLSYGIEKKVSKQPEKFGTGLIQGVAAPETANNAASTSSFITLLSLGIPTNGIMAIILAALVIHGITPGPLFLEKNPDFFWTFIMSMYLGNITLVLLNLPLIPVWVQVLRVPSKILYPLILLFCLIGVYSVRQSTFDILIMIFFGWIGYLMRKYNYEVAPLTMAFVLGPRIEEALRQSLLISRGSLSIFLTRPIAAIFFGIGAILLITSLLPFLKQTKKKMEKFQDDL